MPFPVIEGNVTEKKEDITKDVEEEVKEKKANEEVPLKSIVIDDFQEPAETADSENHENASLGAFMHEEVEEDDSVTEMQ